MNIKKRPQRFKDGNTISSLNQPLQLKSWFFTFNNYELNDITLLEIKFKEICDKYVFQEEIGENETTHLQGVIFLLKRMRYSEFNLSNKIHWEKTRNTDSAIQYCQKCDSRNGNIYKYGFYELDVINRESFHPWQTDLYKTLLLKPDSRQILWLFDKTGGCGKTAFVKYMVHFHNAIFCNGGKCKDIINLCYNNNMEKINIVIWDLPRENEGNVSYSAIECIKNGMISNTKYETGIKLFNSPHIVIFSNYPPINTNHLSNDRWLIYEIINKRLERVNPLSPKNQ